MVDEREDFIRVYPGAFPAEEARALTRHLLGLFAQGFGKSRQAGGHPKTVSDDQQIWEIRDADASDYRGTVMPALFECLKKYVDEFDILQSFTLVGWWLKAQLTRKGEGYHAWHFESASFFESRRVLAWSIYLNDDYEGGELEFLYFGRRMKLGAGDIVIFPAAFTHTHRGNMVLGGEKLLLTGWYELVPSDPQPSSE
ncbi:MAG TPA: 2OG-Fe(II) oxygenase [Polyangia bacterium]|nr:2OG-Fe(II) oxygenase [Polyangia bacterium]